MSAKKVWLVRHGESTSNIGQWHGDPQKILLTPKGEQQAIELAQKVNVNPDLIVVSPYKRALDTAQPILARWSESPVEVWPIQEFSYLSPACQQLTSAQRRELVAAYWKNLNPSFCAEGAESFATFVERLEYFHEQLRTKKGFIIAIGHGQFLKAYTLGLKHGFAATPAWMQLFREQETANPMKNGEIIEIDPQL